MEWFDCAIFFFTSNSCLVIKFPQEISAVVLQHPTTMCYLSSQNGYRLWWVPAKHLLEESMRSVKGVFPIWQKHIG